MIAMPCLSLLLAACPAALPRAAAAQEPGKQEQAPENRNFTIEGTSRMEMKVDKPSDLPQLEPLKPLESYMSQQIAISNASDRVLYALPNVLPSQLSSDVVLLPWHNLLRQSPVLELAVKRPGRLSLTHWRLVITDDQGKVFRMIKGKSKLPERVTWDGFGKSGEALRVGRPYAYSLSVLDRANVPNYLAGKTIRVDGFVQESGGRVTILLDTKALFAQGLRFSETGQTLLREAQDWLRENFQSSLRVDAYGNDADLAQKQADLIRAHLEKALHAQEGGISAHGHLVDKTRYLRAEISTRR